LTDGNSLLLGRHAEDNHRVTFKMAQGRDLWFHLRDGPGSHVILPLNRGQNASDELVMVGAALALHYSSLRGERAEVRVAFRRDLDPVPGHLGRVLVRQERTILIDPRSEIIRQVLDTFGLSLTSSS
jgi:predicted ribosome quality control (RQC) complex YloA/Tae2 family protein